MTGETIGARGKEWMRINKRRKGFEGGLHWIFMVERLCRCLKFNMVLWFIIPLQWMLAVSALCCCAVMCRHPSHPAAAAAAAVISLLLLAAFCDRGNIFPGRYCFHTHKKITRPIFLSACHLVPGIWAGMACDYNNITSALTALRRCALQRGREMEIVNCFWLSPRLFILLEEPAIYYAVWIDLFPFLEDMSSVCFSRWL